jgi:uncharacterized protein involved in outer membrane biogenesis
MRAQWRKGVRGLAYAAGGLVLLAIAGVLALPVLVDQPRAKAALQQRLAGLVQGEVTWDALDLRLLPFPHGTVAGLRLEIPQLLHLRATTVEAGLRWWPLLRGQVELSSLTAVGAQVRLEWKPREAAQPGVERTPDPVAAVRAAVGAAARALREFAPDTQLAIEQGSLDLRVSAWPALRAHALELRVRSTGARATLQLRGAGEHWKRLDFEASFDTAAQSGKARLQVEDLAVGAWLQRLPLPAGTSLTIAPLTLSAALESDGPQALAGRVEAGTRSIRAASGAWTFEAPAVTVKARARVEGPRALVELGEVNVDGARLLEGATDYDFATRDLLGRVAFDLEAGRALALARRTLRNGNADVLEEIQSASGRLGGTAQFAHEAGKWRASLQLGDGAPTLQLRRLPWPLVVRAGSAEWRPGAAHVSAVSGSLGQSSFSALAARLRLGDEPRLESASGAASLDLGEFYPWLRTQPALAEQTRHVAALEGVLEATLLKASGRLASPEAEARIVPRRVRVRADALPDVLTADGGSVRLTRKAAQFEDIALGVLDARARASGSATDLGTRDFRVRTRLADGGAGPLSVGWLLQRAKAPPQLELRTPLVFSAEQLDFGPGQRVDARARIQFDAQTALRAELSWQPGLLELRRLEVRDAEATSTSALRMEGRALQASFSGSMRGAVLAYFLKDAKRFSGRVAGELRFDADLDSLRDATVQGRLRGEGVDLAWLAQRPLLIERFAIDAGPDVMRIGEIAVRSGKDAVTLRGQLRRSEQGPVIDAAVETEGVVLDEWLGGFDKPDAAPAAAAQEPAAPAVKPAAAAADFQHWWPLPVTGRIALRAGYVQHAHLRIAPVALVLVLEPDRARLDVEQAQLCGMAVPFVLEARREAWSASARVAASKQPVNDIARCLTGEHLQITGEADLALELKAQGRGRDLVRNLEGTGRFEARDGRMQKFELVGNILAMLSIEDLATTAKDISEGAKGFRYRRIAGAGRLQGGVFTLQEGAFESPSASMAATGTVRLADGETKMTVLVAPFGRVDRVVRGIPIVGYVIGGTLTSIPVGVSGDIRSPTVVPLGPRAVTEEVLGVFQRTIKLPAKLADPPVSR